MIVCLLVLGVAAAIAVVIVVLLLRKRQAGQQKKLNRFDDGFYERQVVQSTMGSINGNSFNLQSIRDTKDDMGDGGHYGNSFGSERGSVISGHSTGQYTLQSRQLMTVSTHAHSI